MALNPLREVVNVTTRGKWIPFNDLALIIGYHLKSAGVDWRWRKDLMVIMTELFNMEFVEHNPEDMDQVRIPEKWYYDLPI
jgi:hypothetical protein